MKATLYKNVDLVQIPIEQGVTDYFMPSNVAWSNKKVDKLVFIGSGAGTTMVSPMDGVTPVFTALNTIYLSIYSADNTELMHDLLLTNLDAEANHPVAINSVLNLQVCRIHINTTPTAAAVLLCYVFYDSVQSDNYELPKKSVTANFTLSAGEKRTFREIINTYIHALPAKVKCITSWGTPGGFYLTARDHKLDKVFNSISDILLRPQTAAQAQVCPFFVDDLDIDFDYSFVQSADSTKDTDIILTFNY